MDIKSSFASENEPSWLDLLPSKRLFAHLREKGSTLDSGTNGNTMCMIKENLFVWSQEEKALLTVNLKRLRASPKEDTFQTLLCPLSNLPETDNCLLNLIPEESGRYIMLHFRKGLGVIKLQYHRGQHGEFSGGGETVICRTVQVASDIFIINDRLTLVQGSWYPSSPDTVALLTSDNFIRLFSLAEPNLPALEIPLFSPTSIHFYPSTIKLDEYSVVAFSIWNTSVFILHDSGDVSLLPLSPGAKPRMLSMHPQDTKGNYICSSSSMLLLETAPLAVVLAGRSSMDDMMVCHCVYLEAEEEEEEEGVGIIEEAEGVSHDNQKLYVVESINIQSNQSDKVEGDFTLFHDPANPHGYFVRHPEGVHVVHMPWLRKLETFASMNMSTLVSHAECQVNYLLDTEPNFTSLQGVSIVWEARLGYALIGLTACDMECLTLPLDERRWDDGKLESGRLEDGREEGGDYVDGATPHSVLAATLPTSSPFVNSIQEILHPSSGEFSPALKYHKRGKDAESASQADCLQFLMVSIKQLRMTYILRQQLAVKETERRVMSCRRLKQQMVSDLGTLREEKDIIQEESEKLEDKMKRLLARNKNLLDRAKRLACCVELRSPVLSEAEDCMGKEVEGVRDHIKTMEAKITNNMGKLKLCREMNSDPEVDLNASQSTSLLKKLTDNGEKIKILKSMVQNLREVMTS